MRTLPPEPQVGDRVTADLIRELIRCIRERQLLKGPNYTISTGPNGTYLKFDLPKRQNFPREPLPFEVAWRSDVGESGGLAVYLPTAHLLSVDGTYVSIGGVTAINGVHDWFAIDDGNRDAAHVWLLVSKGTDQVVASVTCAESPEGDLCICLAEVVQPESESTERPPTVRQSVVGALVLSLSGDESADFIPPFTLRWSETAWVIWLPDPEQLVMFDGAYTTIGGIAAAPALPAGWYTIDGVAANSGKVWLVITVAKSDSGEITSVSAALSAAEKQAATGETVYNIVVADLSAETKSVKQYVDSAVILGGTISSGEGGGGGAAHGVSGTFTRVTKSEYSTSSHKFINKRQAETFVNGILTEVKDLPDEEVFEATPHTGEMS